MNKLPEVITETELVNALNSDDCVLPSELRTEVSQHISGFMQGVYNLIQNGVDSEQMVLENHPDFWQTGHNALVGIVQKHSM